MGLFRKKTLNSTDLALIFLRNLTRGMLYTLPSDGKLLQEWFSDKSQEERQEVYNELQYLRAVTMDWAIRGVLPQPLGKHVLNEFRKEFEKAGNKIAICSPDACPYYHLYIDRLERYERVMRETKDGETLRSELGKVFTSSCGVNEDPRIATRVTAEFGFMRRCVSSFVKEIQRRYKLMP